MKSASALPPPPARGIRADWVSLARGALQAWRSTLLGRGATATRLRRAEAEWCLRDARSGRALAWSSRGGWQPLSRPAATLLQRRMAGLPSDPGLVLRRALGIDRGHPALRALPRTDEAKRLVAAGYDRYRRPLLMEPRAARAFARMRAAARADGVVLEVVSGFRGLHHQAGIFRRKLARGQALGAILRVNAPPGYSEHHSGRALDLSSPGEPAAEESFEHTEAFAWLRANAGRFGFRLSYPRDNPYGINYEPWHWCWQPPLRLR